MVQETTGRKRPLGITIIAILIAIFGIFSIITGIIALSITLPLAVISLILGVAQLVVVYGLWTLKKWAFWATIVIEALTVLSGVLGLLGFNFGKTGIGALVLALLILIYLFADRKVRPAFGT